MAYKITDTIMGAQPIASTSSTKEHALGTVVRATDPTYEAGEFIYLLGLADTAVGSWVTYNADDYSTTLLVADAIGPVAVAMSANVASQYGWYQIGGKAVGKALTGFLDNGLVYATATAGSIDDAVVNGDRVKGAKGASAVGTPSTGLAEFEISHPMVNDGTEFDTTEFTSSATEINYLDITTLGTGAASKAVVLDAGEDYTWPDTGVLTIGVLATATEAAEHGAGAIGTAAVPTTKRWIERGGVIVTQTTVDLTGLASVATANDVIGLAAGGAAYIGRNVVATNGVIYKVEFSCLETPAGGDNDVNVVANASAALAYDGAGGTTYLSNSGDLLAGQTIENLLPALTANDYFYLTAGTGDTAATYTAGMYVLTTYGHAVLA